ncbi:MAG: helix-turn-helix domain-containing protein [Prosthecobacter sp.]|uniref:helix-turn-helix domain-containing protein n=1 Tax=Prosthecobacter sp. TaxID=1965333 RepID=UPI003BB045E8
MPKPVFIKKKPAKKPGRPTLLNPTRQAALLKAIEQGMPLKQAAAIAGMSYDTLNNWQNRGENESAPPEFRQFCQLLRHSQAVAMQVHVSSICDAAKRDWRAAAWMLERRCPEDFARPQQFEHSGPGGKPLMPDPDVNHEVLVRMKKQQGIVELLKKMGGIISEKRLQKEENAKAEREAAMLQKPFVLNMKQAKPKRAPLRE